MKNDRLRSPLQNDYAHILGVFTFTFATLEWNVAWCCERMKSGSLNKFRKKKCTAGDIAHTFKDLVRNMKASPTRTEWTAMAQDFIDLVEKRNHVIHGKPCTSPEGLPRLSSTQMWNISDLEDLADQFVECSGKFNALLYGALAAKT
jgi:hypothetical protein